MLVHCVSTCCKSHSGVFTFNKPHNIPKTKCCGQTRHHPNSFNKDENTINTVSRKLEVIFIKAWRGAAVITVRQCKAWLAIPFVFSDSRQVLCSPSTVCFSPCLPLNKALFLGHFSLYISGTSASLCHTCIFNLSLRFPTRCSPSNVVLPSSEAEDQLLLNRNQSFVSKLWMFFVLFFSIFPLSPLLNRMVTSLNTGTKTRTTRESLVRCSWEITTLQQCHWNLWEPSRV